MWCVSLWVVVSFVAVVLLVVVVCVFVCCGMLKKREKTRVHVQKTHVHTEGAFDAYTPSPPPNTHKPTQAQVNPNKQTNHTAKQ